MEHLEHPSEELWNKRRYWFESIEEETRGEGSYLVSEQASALIADVQSSFCAGAWLSVIVLSLSVIDAQLRETEIPNFKGNTKDLLKESKATSKTDWLRKKRNKLVHVNPENPEITVDMQWFDRESLENDARETVKLMFGTFYMSPSV